MSTDRELLELAAKAAGVYLAWNGEFPVQVFERWSGNPDEQPDYDHSDWNPLTDDGDALRLAASTRLRVDFYDNQVEVKDGCDLYMIGNEEFENTFVRIEPLEHHGDLLSAARRAIVRAAAEIGRAMP